MARRLLGTDDVERLWDVLAPLLRLDAADPAGRRGESTSPACGADEAARGRRSPPFFRGPGTDLTVPLLPGARWHSGGITTTWGRETVANMPTEEVFTTPDAEASRARCE